MTTRTQVGAVSALYRYPVKSMRGESLEVAQVGWHGLEGDRRYAFVQAENPSNFPWLTARQIPELVRYAPCAVDPRAPSRSQVRVRTPAGADLPIESEELRDALAERFGAPVYLLHSGCGLFDVAAVSLLSAASVRAIGDAIGEQLAPRRFRPNILIETEADEPFEEETWLGRLLVFGENGARIRVNQKDKRCVMVNIDPESLERRPAVLKEIAQQRENCAGLYLTPEAPGPIHVGDAVYLMAE